MPRRVIKSQPQKYMPNRVIKNQPIRSVRQPSNLKNIKNPFSSSVCPNCGSIKPNVYCATCAVR